MLIVRGVNVYPSALANILHRFPEVTEYRVIVTSGGTMDEIALQVECPPQLAAAISEELHLALNLRIVVATWDIHWQNQRFVPARYLSPLTLPSTISEKRW